MKNTSMKTLIKFLCLAIAASFISLYSQYRYVDLENKFLEPKDSHFIKLPSTLDIKFSVKNLGPDTLFVGDTISYGYLFFKQFPYTFYELKKNLNPGDSVIISEVINVTEVPSNEPYSGYSALSWSGTFPIPWNRSNGTHAPLSLYKDKRDNSIDAVIIHWSGSLNSIPNSISKIKSIVYPNPVDQLLSIKSEQAISSVYIFNVVGKAIVGQAVNGQVAADIPTANLPSGIYIVRVQYHNGEWESFKIEKY
jgi:hypothetical protein